MSLVNFDGKGPKINIGQGSNTPANQSIDEKIDNILEILHNYWFEDDYEYDCPGGVEARQSIKQLITEARREAYCDVGNYATDCGDTKLMDFIDSRLSELKGEV